MAGIYGLLLLLSDFLSKVPMLIWIIGLIILYILTIKSAMSTDVENKVGYVFFICSMLFFVMIMGKYKISVLFAGIWGFKYIIAILATLIIPYLASLLLVATTSIFKRY